MSVTEEQEIDSIREVLKEARVLSVKAMRRLGEALDSEKEIVRVRAAESILDRGLGKPAQTIYHGEAQRRLHELSDAELERIAAGGGADSSDAAESSQEPSNVH